MSQEEDDVANRNIDDKLAEMNIKKPSLSADDTDDVPFSIQEEIIEVPADPDREQVQPFELRQQLQQRFHWTVNNR